MNTITIDTTDITDTTKPVLHNYKTGEFIRNATPEELQSSIDAARNDGGSGVIIVDGQSCYVVE